MKALEAKIVVRVGGQVRGQVWDQVHDQVWRKQLHDYQGERGQQNVSKGNH